MSEPIRIGGDPQDDPSTAEPVPPPEGAKEEKPTTGGKKKETRYEIGFFVRRVEEESATPPDYGGPVG